MRQVLQSVLDELQRLKAAGQSTVSVSESSLASLRHAVDRLTTSSHTQDTGLVAQPSPGNPSSSGARADQSPAVRQASGPIYVRREESKGPGLLESYLAGNTGPLGASSGDRSEQSSPSGALANLPELNLPEGDKTSRMTWLRQRAATDPTAKALTRQGRSPVLGTGSLDARLMFIVEAPFPDDEAGLPAQPGSPGELLARMITAMGLPPSDVYSAAIMTWRPQVPASATPSGKDSRDPTVQEMAYCAAYLKAQIDIIRPSLLVGFGASTAKGLLGAAQFKTLFDARGKWHEYHGVPLMITYHPNYLLHKATEGKLAEKKAKRGVWEDLLLVMEKAGIPASEKQRAYFT